MDEREFQRRLSEVAEWHRPKPIDVQPTKLRRKLKNEPIPEDMENCVQNTEPNYPISIIRIKHQGETCADCGEFCENGRQKEAKLSQKNGTSHWRQKCLNCNLWQNPFTGVFDLNGYIAAQRYNEFQRKSKGIYKTKGNLMREQLANRVSKNHATENTDDK